MKKIMLTRLDLADARVIEAAKQACEAIRRTPVSLSAAAAPMPKKV